MTLLLLKMNTEEEVSYSMAHVVA